MYHQIVKMNQKLEFIDENKKKTSLEGYAFMDSSGGCIIIVYGDGRRDQMSEYLDNSKDPLGLKYRIIDLKTLP
jgi:hypothetical protein